jgi:acyl-CoA thioester hydrolase
MKKLIVALSVYTFDIDYNRHVSNIVFVRWMEQCRNELFSVIELSLEELTLQDCLPVVVETQVFYKKPVFFGQSVKAEMWLSELAKASCWMTFHFFNNEGELVVIGRQKGVFIGATTNRPVRPSVELRQKFERYLILEEGTN